MSRVSRDEMLERQAEATESASENDFGSGISVLLKLMGVPCIKYRAWIVGPA